LKRTNPNASHERPSETPISFWAQRNILHDLGWMIDAIRDDPFGLGCAVEADLLSTARAVRISHGEMRLRMPVYGTWPIDDLSPMGILVLLRELHEDALRRTALNDPQAEELEDLVAAAVAITTAMGGMPEKVVRESDGSIEVEVCLSEERRFDFWVETDDPENAFFQLKPDPAVLAKMTGRVRIPCHAWPVDEGLGIPLDEIGPSMSDQEGIKVLAQPLDAVAMLRMHAAMAEARASDAS
jgi:hypothetical protein